jgi:hypothetical protein
MDDKITIIEGPPPTFEVVDDHWALALNEGPSLSDIALTRLRTFSGPSLVERCYRAWHKHNPIYLEFRTEDGLNQSAPIVAARYVETDEGHMLLLWVRLEREENDLELNLEDDEGDTDSDSYPPDTGFPLGPSDWSL